MDLRVLWIGLGGMTGTIARYFVSSWMLDWLGPGFAWGTLAVNLSGSFLLGFIVQVSLSTDLVSPTVRLALTTGAMGGFTTYSTFSLETWTYLESRAWLLAGANLSATVLGCLAGTALGMALARAIFGP
jgi:CrcB protein